MMAKAVFNYNNKRPHDHLQRTTPVDFENKLSLLPGKKGKTMTIFDNEKTK
jgi:hypothetical protein